MVFSTAMLIAAAILTDLTKRKENVLETAMLKIHKCKGINPWHMKISNCFF